MLRDVAFTKMILLIFSLVINLINCCQSVVSQKKQQSADDDSYFKPIIIPWLQKEQKDEGRQETSPEKLPVEEAPREAAKEETREIEDKGLVSNAMASKSIIEVYFLFSSNSLTTFF